MTLKSGPYFWVECDWEDCAANAQEDGEYAAWSEASAAVDDADSAGWLIVRSPDATERYYCTKHSHWSEDEDMMVPGPLVQDGSES